MREGLKPLVFVLQTTAGILLHAQRGGAHDFRLRSTTTTFVYMPHSAVVIPRESARNVARKEKGGDESDPPAGPLTRTSVGKAARPISSSTK